MIELKETYDTYSLVRLALQTVCKKIPLLDEHLEELESYFSKADLKQPIVSQNVVYLHERLWVEKRNIAAFVKDLKKIGRLEAWRIRTNPQLLDATGFSYQYLEEWIKNDLVTLLNKLIASQPKS